MGRAKIPIELIKDDKKRNITFHRRKDGIIKKAQELTKLCDVNISMIIYSDYQETPQIFPPDPSKLESLINLYNQPGRIQSYGLSDYFKDRKNKIQDELSKAKKKTLEAVYPTWFDFLNDFSEAKLRDFSSVLTNKIDHVRRKIESVKKTSKIQNLDPFYTGSSVLGGQSSLITPLLNPSPMKMMIPMMGYDHYDNFGFDHNVEFCGDQNNLNPNSENPISVMKMMMPLDYNNLGFDPTKLYGDENNLITQASNSSSMMKLLGLSEDDDECYNRENFSCQSPPPEFFYPPHEYGFPPEMLQQAEAMPPFMHMN